VATAARVPAATTATATGTAAATEVASGRVFFAVPSLLLGCEPFTGTLAIPAYAMAPGSQGPQFGTTAETVETYPVSALPRCARAAPTGSKVVTISRIAALFIALQSARRDPSSPRESVL